MKSFAMINCNGRVDSDGLKKYEAQIIAYAIEMVAFCTLSEQRANNSIRTAIANWRFLHASFDS